MQSPESLSNYFKSSEFACKCGKCGGGIDNMQSGLLTALVSMRAMAGFPFILNSAYRCEPYNSKVGGSTDSAHTRGYAVDIRVTNSAQRYKLVQLAMEHGIRRIGIYKTFVHIDTDPGLPQPVMWLG